MPPTDLSYLKKNQHNNVIKVAYKKPVTRLGSGAKYRYNNAILKQLEASMHLSPIHRSYKRKLSFKVLTPLAQKITIALILLSLGLILLLTDLFS